MNFPVQVHLERDDLFDALVRADYEKRMVRVKLSTEHHHKRHLRAQSIVGHANKGHGAFQGGSKLNMSTVKTAMRYPNADIHDVIDAIGQSKQDRVQRHLRERQNVIDQVSAWLNDAANGHNNKNLGWLVRNEYPLLGISEFRDEWLWVYKPTDVVDGVLAGVAMDNFNWRRKVQDRFGHEMGGGIITAVDMNAMKATGLTLETLASIPFAQNVPVAQIDETFWELEKGDGMAWLKQEGVVVDLKKKKFTPTGNIRQQYVRLVKGLGVSDDAAIVTATFLHGQDYAKGVILADGLDTWDKATPIAYVGGQDEKIAQDIRSARGTKRMEEPDHVETFIYLSAIDRARHTHYPDCSQRRLLETKRGGKGKTYAMREHLMFGQWLRKFVNDETFDPAKAMQEFHKMSFGTFRIGFDAVPIRDFYKEMIRHYGQFQREQGPIGHYITSDQERKIPY